LQLIGIRVATGKPDVAGRLGLRDRTGKHDGAVQRTLLLGDGGARSVLGIGESRCLMLALPGILAGLALP
jgi:hypothetical protein